MNRIGIIFAASVGLLVGLVLLLARTADDSAGDAQTLVVYCGAGLQKPVQEAARRYEQDYGVRVQLSFEGSQSLLSRIQVARTGDLFIPGDDSYLNSAAEMGLVKEQIPLAHMRVVLAVRQGNPRNIRSIEDLARSDVRLAQANPQAAAVGKLTVEALGEHPAWPEIDRRTVVYKPTVMDVANDLRIGSVDAGFVWNTTMALYPDLEAVELPELADAAAHIAVGVLASSDQPTAALRFARYLGAPEKGLVHFEQAGYDVAEGDTWALVPEIRLLSGAMLRLAIEQTITDFEQREGVRVTRVYNGCGILLSQLNAGERPDAYFACDVSFMTPVQDLFLDAVDISENRLSIAVPKDNPHQLASMADLTAPGLRVGVAHERQSALGALTQRTLNELGLREAVMANVVVQSPTGDYLVNQLRVGSLDAIIVYRSNTALQADHFETFEVDLPSALAIQPLAVGKESAHKLLSGRLMQAIRSAQSRELFQTYRFGWKGGGDGD